MLLIEPGATHGIAESTRDHGGAHTSCFGVLAGIRGELRPLAGDENPLCISYHTGLSPCEELFIAASAASRRI